MLWLPLLVVAGVALYAVRTGALELAGGIGDPFPSMPWNELHDRFRDKLIDGTPPSAVARIVAQLNAAYKGQLFDPGNPENPSDNVARRVLVPVGPGSDHGYQHVWRTCLVRRDPGEAQANYNEHFQRAKLPGARWQSQIVAQQHNWGFLGTGFQLKDIAGAVTLITGVVTLQPELIVAGGGTIAKGHVG